MRKLLVTLFCLLAVFIHCQGQTIINKYAAVLSYDPCKNALSVDTATGFNVGDTVLLIQMKGATIDTSNSANFGDILSYNGAGNYEYNTISAKTGNSLNLTFKLARTYDIPNGKVQIVRVPYAATYNANQPLTCMQWNGSKGGVFALNVAGTLTVSSTINVDGKGFRGAAPLFSTLKTCNQTNYFYPVTNNYGAPKGEGIALISASKMYGRGALANGGGGGNDHNAGGGGGSNSATGGVGGNQHAYGACGAPIIYNIGGEPGKGLIYNTTNNKIFLGGAGGTGHGNDLSEKSGGNGGGIVIISAGSMVASGGAISANGANAPECSSAGAGCQDDGGGGGGAGGTILIKAGSVTNTLSVSAIGGTGSDVYEGITSNQVYRTGPGAGGSGGVVWVNSAAVQGALTTSLAGGSNGVLPQFGNDAFGAQPGQSGNVLNGLQLSFPVDSFKGVNPLASDSVIDCGTFKFSVKNNGGTGLTQIQWDFGDGGSSGANPVTHAYAANGSYTVRVIVTDTLGCKDTAFLTVTPGTLDANIAVSDDTVCIGQPVQFTSSVTGGTVSHKWVFGDGSTATVSPATHSYTQQGLYTIRYIVTNSANCSDTDTIKVFVLPPPNFGITPPHAVLCKGDTIRLVASGGQIYHWSPATGMDDPSSSSPFVFTNSAITYTVYITNTVCNLSDTLSVDVTLAPKPQLGLTKSNDIDCGVLSSQLQAKGAFKYEWTPAATLDDHHIANPVASPTITTAYMVIGETEYGCKDSLKITVFVEQEEVKVFVPDAFTPNGDGRNDCLRVHATAPVSGFEFLIFNRWGEKVFQANDISECWNGTYNNYPQDIGTYFYYYKVKTAGCGDKFVKGSVHIIR